MLKIFSVSCFIVTNRIQRPKNFPPGPRPVPLLGNLFELTIGDPLKDFERLAQRYGNVYSFYLMVSRL
ncbi:hypothetical protein SRHO_G00118040 [Serrasalmus rhombeus]